jgi:hypothetical protein
MTFHGSGFKPTHGSGFKPPIRYSSFVNGTSFPSPGMRDAYDSMKRSQDSNARLRQESDRFMTSMRRHMERAQSSPPRASFSARTGRARGSALGVVVRLGIFAMVLVYVLPHVLSAPPPELLDARPIVTASLKSAAELAPPDVASSIDAFIEEISR